MTRSRAEYEIVMDLVRLGYDDVETSRWTGVPRRTVCDWRTGLYDGARRAPVPGDDLRCPGEHDYSNLPPRQYSYLLGMYLGDGYISEGPRSVFHLRITMDSQYQGIVDETSAAMEAVMPGQRAARRPRRGVRCLDLSMHSKHWPCLFPQHGPGRKHEREIQLAPWQEEILDDKMFIRSLIHSDGCRIIANDRGVPSIRYHFTNLSEDIKALYCASLDRLGIPWTRPCNKQIAIYRKAAVAMMDQFVGPKT